MKTILSLLVLTFTLFGVDAQEHPEISLLSPSRVNGPVEPLHSPDMDSVATACMERLTSSSLIDLFPQRPFYNRSFKFSTGFSLNTLRVANTMMSYSDTSEHHFTINGHSPVFSFTQHFAIDSTFSLSYTLGYSQSDIRFDNTNYGTRRYSLSLNPQLHLFRSYDWEYYMALRIGVIYYDNQLESLPSDILRRILPGGFKMFTGFTVAGINYLVTDHLAMNAEVSLWSQETVHFGLSYRFFKDRHKSAPAFSGGEF